MSALGIDAQRLGERIHRQRSATATIDIIPETGQNYRDLSGEVMMKNYHESQMKAAAVLKAQFGALPGRTRRAAGLSEAESRAMEAAKEVLPRVFEMQQEAAECETMRLMWGPDAVMLIDSARALHRTARAGTL